MELDGMELDLTPGTGVAPKTKMSSADDDARARALAIETGAKWKCSRVKQWVNMSDCVAMHADAAGPQHCKECSTVAKYLFQQGVSAVGKAATRVAAKTEFRTAENPEQSKTLTTASTQGDILAGLTMYSPLARVLSSTAELPYAHLGQSALSFSRKAVAAFCIHKHETATLIFEGEPGNITRIVVHLGAPMLRLTSPSPTSLTRNISAHGLVKHLRLQSLVGHRYAIREIKPGYLEIDFSKTVDVVKEKATAEEAA